MWKRLRRRTMAPRRPALYPDQLPLAILTGLVVVLSLALVIWVVVR